MNTTQHYEVERPCPNCHKPPTLRGIENGWAVECAAHGHIAHGNSLKEAIHNWNIYIKFVSKGAL